MAASSVICCLLAAGATPLPADVIRLRSGGEIRGQIHRSSTDDHVWTITTLSGARVSVRREDVEFATHRSPKVEEYETRAREIPHAIDAHWELAEWCRENRLSRQRDEQLELILELDPDHEAARRGLGYTLHGARWMTRHEAMLADGYIRHEGQYVTPQELDLIEQSEEQREAEQAWVENVRLWFGWATGRHEARMADGIGKLQEIRDPDAIPALVRIMADHDDTEVRRLFVRLLARMDGTKPIAPLVHRSLVDAVPEIRREAREALKPEQHKAAVALYVAALQNELRLIVCRAAEALAEIGDRSAIEPLIDALVTEHRYRVTYQEQTPSYAVSSDGGIGFAGSTSPLPPNIDLLARTGQLPYGAIVLPPPGRTVTKSTLVKRREQNVEVLSALKKLTGQSFGFDIRTWRLWWAANQNGTVWTDTP
jgi:hypothetical protein